MQNSFSKQNVILGVILIINNFSKITVLENAILIFQLGSKKGGLGATRVKADFAEIEREAELADQLKMQEKTPSVPEKSSEEQESQV